MIRTINDKDELYDALSSGLELSSTEFAASVGEGETYKAGILVNAAENAKIRAQVSTDNARIITERERYAGSSFMLNFGVDTTGLHGGDVVRGNIYLATDAGEYAIPVEVAIVVRPLESAYGTIRNLDDFARLARGNYEEAYRMFTSPAFARILEECDEDTKSLYKGLARNPVTYQRVEEFLVAACGKKPVSISADVEEGVFYNVDSSLQQTVTIHRSGWGYLDIQAEADGDFIEIPRKRILGDDFVGSVCEFNYIIRDDRMGKGRYFGKVIIRTLDQVIEIPVTASKSGPLRVDMGTISRKNIIKLTRLYVDYETDKIECKAYCTGSRSLLAAIREMGDYPTFYELYEAYIEETAGNRQDARRIMKQISSRDFRNESAETKAMFLYMGHITGFLDPQQMDIVGHVREWQRRNRESFFLLWVLFRIDPDYLRSPAKKIYAMEELFKMGCRSPLLYIEALTILRRDGSYMRRLGLFMRHVMTFAVKKEILPRDLASRLAHLSENEKTFTQPVYRLLANAYELYPLPELLTAIIHLLMKGMPVHAEYFKWYSLGVESDYRITRLYEFYVETMPETYQKLLPKQIRKYFALNTMISDRKKAFIYANIIRNADRDPATYERYEEAMKEFAVKSLAKRKIDTSYAVLYQTFSGEIARLDLENELAEVMFTCRIFTDDRRVREVVICHEELEGEEVVQVRQGEAFVNRYTPNAKVLFSDGRGNRFANAVPFSEAPLMDCAHLADICRARDCKSTGFLLYTTMGSGQMEEISARNFDAMRHIEESGEFAPFFRSKVRSQILRYIAQHAENESLDVYLKGVDYRTFSGEDKELLAAAMITRGFYREAFALLCKFGYEHVEPGQLAHLSGQLIREKEGNLDEDLLLLACAAFRQDNYDEDLLGYLVRWYDGNLDEMVRIRQAAERKAVPTVEIDERILNRCMFVKRLLPEGEDILESYAAKEGKKQVIQNYITFEADTCFAAEEAIGDFVADYIVRCIDDGEETELSWRLALLLYFSGKNSFSIHEESLIDSILDECAARGLRFAFFKRFPASFLTQYELEDKIFVEQHARPDDTVILHYRLLAAGEMEKPYDTVPLERIYRGIFSREFVLLYGETLEYYVTISRNGQELRSENHAASADTCDMDGRSRYQMINQMLECSEMEEPELLIEMIRQYRQTEELVNTLFVLEDKF
ncbi:MAG: DUF5717 family protein [Lachnospiraceae bacterium]|nr:DUF5717 family protein [Lachnospiraceae bacterium]